MSNGERRSFVGLVAVLGLIVLGSVDGVHAQEKYPTRPIEIIVGLRAGGSADTVARLIASGLTKKWGVPVNVTNKPGGEGVPAALEVYKSAPNGYTMLMDTEQNTLMSVIKKDMPFDIMTVTYTAMFSNSPLVLLVNAASPYKTAADLIAAVKSKPEYVTWAAPVSAGDVCVRRFFSAIGVNHSVPKLVMTRGGAESVTLVAGGHVTLTTATVISALPAIRGGTARALFVTSRSRYPDLPEVPTTTELGMAALDSATWQSISGPPKLPAHIVSMWDKALQELLNDPDVIAKMKNVGAIPFYHDAASTMEYRKREIQAARELYK